MSAGQLHRVEIVAGLTGRDTTVRIDGKPIERVVSVKIEAGVQKVTLVTLQFFAEAKVEGPAEVVRA